MIEGKGIVEQPHSTEISINAKGAWSGCVKVYGVNPEDSFQQALFKATALEKIIRDKNNNDILPHAKASKGDIYADN